MAKKTNPKKEKKKSVQTEKMPGIKEKAEEIRDKASEIIEEIDENETKKASTKGDPLVTLSSN